MSETGTNDSHSAANPAARAAVQTSNNTSNYFLGAAPRSWMANSSGNVPAAGHSQPAHPQSIPVSRRHQSERTHTRKIPELTGGPTSTSPPLAPNPARRNGKPSLTHSHPATPITPSDVQHSVVQQAERAQISNHGLQIAHVKDSAASLREGQVQVVDLETGPGISADQAAQLRGYPPQGHDTPNSEPMVAITSSEQQPRVNVAVSNPNTHNTESSSRNDHSPSLPTALPVSASHGEVRKRQHSANDSCERCTRRRMIGNKPDSTQLPTPQDSPTTSSTFTLEGQLDAALRSLPPHRTIDLEPILDEGRITLLRRACRESDHFFILVNALICVFPDSRSTDYERFSLGPEHIKGLQILQEVLGSSRRLSKEVSELFRGFPRPLHALMLDSRFHNSGGLFEAVKRSLLCFSANYAYIRDRSISRGSPPCSAELLYELQLPSAALQCTLFSSVMQYLPSDGEWLRRATAIFESDMESLAAQSMSLSVLTAHRGAEVGQFLNSFTARYMNDRHQYIAEAYGQTSAATPSMRNHSQVHNGQAVFADRGAVQTPLVAPPSYQLPISSGAGTHFGLATSPTFVAHGPSPVQIPNTGQNGVQDHARRVSQPSNLNSGRTSHILQNGRRPGPVLASQAAANPSVGHMQAVVLPAHATMSTRNPPNGVMSPSGPSSGNSYHAVTALASFSGHVPQSARPHHLPSALVQHNPSMQTVPPGFTEQQMTPQTISPSANVPQHGTLRTRRLLPAQPQRPLQARPPCIGQQPPSQPPGHFFFPRDHTFNLAIAAVPNPDRTALHQAHLRSPQFRKASLSEASTSDARYYQYVEGIIELPDLITNKSDLKRWKLNVPHEVWVRKAESPPPTGDYLSRERIVSNGFVQFRLKSVSYKSGAAALAQPKLSEFCVQSTKWPKCLSVSINGDVGVDFRRKAHFGVDLATDVTDLLREGENEVVIGCLFTPAEINTTYRMAIEIICINDHTTVMSMPDRITASESLSSIIAAIKSSDNGKDDDDLIVSQPVISIDLVDPFMSVMWVTPVRSRECQHRECFDLEAYLLSRTSRFKHSILTSVEQWKCPICKKDARPMVLIIDEFLLEVRKTLEQNAQLDARAILVQEDGSWKIKTDQPPVQDQSRADGKPRPSTTSSEATSQSRQLTALADTELPTSAPDPAIVIVLDDEDD